MRIGDYVKGPTLAVALVNSYSPVYDRDTLPDLRTLAAFLKRYGIRVGQRLTLRDLKEIRRVRSLLRKVFMAGEETRAASLLNQLLAGFRALPQLEREGTSWLLCLSAARDQPAARLAVEAATGLATVISELGFKRLRVCAGGRCLDVFVDMSRNRSRRYCSPRICGNRASVAAYRARQRAKKGPASIAEDKSKGNRQHL